MEDLVKKLKELADEYRMVDVGSGAAKMLGVTQAALNSALLNLEKNGYFTYSGPIQQATAVRRIIMIKVLCRPGVDRKDIFTDKVYHLA